MTNEISYPVHTCSQENDCQDNNENIEKQEETQYDYEELNEFYDANLNYGILNPLFLQDGRLNINERKKTAKIINISKIRKNKKIAKESRKKNRRHK